MSAVVCPLYERVKVPPVAPPPIVTVCKLSIINPWPCTRKNCVEPACRLVSGVMPTASASSSSLIVLVGLRSKCAEGRVKIHIEMLSCRGLQRNSSTRGCHGDCSLQCLGQHLATYGIACFAIALVAKFRDETVVDFVVIDGVARGVVFALLNGVSLRLHTSGEWRREYPV